MTQTHSPFQPGYNADDSDAGAAAAGLDPDGTINEIMAWVGDDLDRAHEAYLAETEKGSPRPRLVNRLENMLTGPDQTE